MPVQLGQGYRTPEPPAAPTGDERRHQELLAELAALRDTLLALAQQPAPTVTVPAPDLSEILYALDGLGVAVPTAQPTDPRAIGEAVAVALQANRVEVPDRTDEVLEELKRIGRKFGMALANSAPVVSNDISSNPARVLGQVEVTATPGLTRAELDAAPVTIAGSVEMDAGASVLTSSLINRKVAEGKFFFAGKAISAGGALSTTRPSFMISNPASLPNGTANTKTLFVVLISVYSDVSQQIQYRESATLAGPNYVTPRGWNRRLAQHPASVAQIAWDDASPSGGTTLPNESRIYNTSPLALRFEPAYEIPPGMTFTLDFQSTATQITTANGYWYEE